jgi:hypothetical protein
MPEENKDVETKKLYVFLSEGLLILVGLASISTALIFLILSQDKFTHVAFAAMLFFLIIIIPFMLLGLISIIFGLSPRKRGNTKTKIIVVLVFLFLFLHTFLTFPQAITIWPFEYLATTTRNESMCNMISDANHKSLCYSELGKEKKDRLLCNKTVENWGRTECYTELAVFTKNGDFCEELNTTYHKDFCYHTAAKANRDKLLCKNITSLTLRESCEEELK